MLTALGLNLPKLVCAAGRISVRVIVRPRTMNRIGDSTRAARYPIKVPLRYRFSGEWVWQKGRTENISATGVLFRCKEITEQNKPIEIHFVLPIETKGEGGAEVICHGKIVRTDWSYEAGCVCTLAAKITDYRLMRGYGMYK